MTDHDKATVTKTPVHLWIVGILSLLWNLMGAFDYSATQLKLEFYMSNFNETQLEYFYGIPAWAVAGWAVAVWFSLAGSLLLLCRKSLALYAFGIAVGGMLLSTIYNFGLSNGAEVMGTGGVIFSAVIWIIALLLIVYAWKQEQNGVLR